MAGTLEASREGRSGPVSGRSTSRRWFSSAKHRAHQPRADHDGHVGSVFPPLKRETQLFSRRQDNEGKSMDSRSRLLGLNDQEMTVAELSIP